MNNKEKAFAAYCVAAVVIYATFTIWQACEGKKFREALLDEYRLKSTRLGMMNDD